jgi:uncharacterized circularly permuted ATP-grasp superfamily protein/uncharacterized alpha-E superfamily protein
MSVTAPSSIAVDPLADYTGLPGRYDECRATDGSLRPHWAEFVRLLGSQPAATLKAASEATSRAITEQDVSMNVYSGDRSAALPWPLDAVPNLVTAADWVVLTSGLCQRARLYNELLNDLYGAQKLLRSGALPAVFAMANPRFLRPCVGLGHAGGIFLHHYAVDLARSPDGQWWVLQDRLDSPSGLGYSLQNRIITRQALPHAFGQLPVQRLYSFFHDFRQSLHAPSRARAGGEEPRTVFLTPGAANETYFEHAYLARYLGYPLVEGADLITRDRQVFIRTVGGLKRVNALVRRVDSNFCDPLELNEHSLLGIPGLVHAAQGGHVCIANQLGASAFESAAMLAFLAPLCRTVLGEELQLPSVATWWCGQKTAANYVLDQLANLVIKPTFRHTASSATLYGPNLDEAARAQLAADISARPWAYCGQERVLLGTTPAYRDGKIQPMPFVLRLFVAWHEGEYRVMPGGLTRFSPGGEDAIVSLQQGSITKDTWVLSDKPVEDNRISAASFAEANRRAIPTPSRLADNLFWSGRYLDRTAQLSRLLDKLDPLLRDEISSLDRGVTTDALTCLLRAQDSPVPPDTSFDELAAQIRLRADDPTATGSLAGNLSALIRNLDAAKVRFPPEAWRILRRFRAIAGSEHPQLASDLTEQLSALEALAIDMLAHDVGWHFLTLGRRIERAAQLLAIASHLLTPSDPTEFRLQTALYFTDSLFTYRDLHPAGFQFHTALHWLLAAVENPRGLRFQADEISQHLAALPDEVAPRAVAAVRATAFKLVSQTRLLDPSALASNLAQRSAFFRDASALLLELSNQISLVYFSHADSPA